MAHGFAVRHGGLDAVYALNAVVLTEPLPAPLTADVVAALADEALAGLPHRQIVVDDEAAGARVAPGLTARGYDAMRIRYLVTMAIEPPPFDPRARELSEHELRCIQLAVFDEDNHGPYASPELPGALAGAQAAVRTHTPARGFGAGGAVSTATLFCDEDVNGHRIAMIDQVATLRAHREQGLARAAVTAAIHAAHGWGAELIVVPVDAEDWPQLMFASLGFAPIGESWVFTRRPPGSGSAAR